MDIRNGASRLRPVHAYACGFDLAAVFTENLDGVRAASNGDSAPLTGMFDTVEPVPELLNHLIERVGSVGTVSIIIILEAVAAVVEQSEVDLILRKGHAAQHTSRALS